MEEKKFNLSKYVILIVVFAGISAIAGSLIGQLIDSDFNFETLSVTVGSIIKGFSAPRFGTYFLISFLACCSIPLFISTNKPKSSIPKGLLDANYDTKSDKKGAAKWLSKAEISKVFPRYTYDDAGKYKVNGFVVQVIETKKATYANLKGDVHCLIIGTTGSGKTIRFVIPTMQFLARSASRPSLIVTDPKGELYQTQTKLYQEKGYDIIALNLRDPLKRSNCWNPCHIAWSEYQEALVQKQKIKFHYDDVNSYRKKIKLVNKKNEYYEEWYEFNNYAFANLKDAILEAERQENSLKAKAMESISDLVNTIYAESAKRAQDPFWVKSASNLVEGLLIAMLEDSEIDELGITSQNFNLGTVASTLALRVDQLKSYFAVRDVNSFSKRKAQGAIDAPQSGTQQSIISTAMADLTAFSDPDILYITCNNDINFKDIGRKPTAVFLIVPDEKENRHIFASLFITQAYKSLVELATESGGKLPHPVNFIIDEFANLPVIPGMENKITVARSRGMAFMLIIQALSQLRAKYGPDVAEIIKTNCNLQIFLATNDNETAEYFSKICGEKTIKEVSSSKDGDGKDNYTYSLSSRPLIKPEELLTLPEGTSIVKYLRTQPAKLQQMEYWKSRSYYIGEQTVDSEWNPELFLFEDQGFYDIVNRSRLDASYLQKPLEIYDPELIIKEREANKTGGSESSGGGDFYGGESSGSGGGSGFSLFEDREDHSRDYDSFSPLNTDLSSLLKEGFQKSEEYFNNLDSKSNLDLTNEILLDQSDNFVRSEDSSQKVDGKIHIDRGLQNFEPKKDGNAQGLTSLARVKELKADKKN